MELELSELQPENIADEDDALANLSPWDIEWDTGLFKKQSDFQDEKSADNKVGDDDYSEEELSILKVMRAHIRDACNVNTVWKKRKKALEWCFVRGVVDKHDLAFHDACAAMGARPEVIQSRLHHQLYVAGVSLREPLPLWADLLPEQYNSESIMAAWDDGLALITEIWRWPGITAECLESRSGVSPVLPTLEKLEKSGLIAWRFGCIFLTGRSPDRLLKRSFSWSKSFF